jgi:hypothetical protein
LRTKTYAVAATIIVYCMVLACFAQSRDLSRMRYERLSRLQPPSYDLTEFAVGLVGAVKESEPELELVLGKEPEEPVLSVDPLLAQTIREFNEEISWDDSERLARLIEGTANMYGVDPYLVAALVSQESCFHENAVSPVGALGLGQLMPETAADLGVDPYQPEQNLDGCVRYLALNLEVWSGSEDPVALALASYNAGPGAVEQYGGIPPYEETQNYVAIIKYRYDLLRSGHSALG